MRKNYKPIIPKFITDPKYNNNIILRIINIFMLSGKKNKSYRIIYSVMSMIRLNFKLNPLTFILKVIDILKPPVFIKKRKIGGAIYNIPFWISSYQSVGIAIRWIKKSLLKYSYNTSISLFREMVSIYNGNGYSLLYRNNLYKLAINNRAFSIYS